MSRLRNRVRDWAAGSVIRIGLLATVAVALLAQLIPYGHAHSNPPATQPARFDSGQTAELVDNACAACHSNLTSWPIESNVAPFSWLIEHDVADGRNRLNFSEWDRGQPSIAAIRDVIDGGAMPPLQYKLLHPGSRLSDSERQQLIDGLTRTYLQDPPGP